MSKATLDYFGVVTDDSGELATHVRHNLKLVAGSREVAHSRNHALFVAFAKACGCGGKGNELWVLLQSGTSAPQTMNLDLGDRTRVLSETMRSHGADFEAELSAGTWPGDYGTDAEIGNLLAHWCLQGGPPGDVAKLLRTLYYDAQIDLTRVIDWQAGARGNAISAVTHVPLTSSHRGASREP